MYNSERVRFVHPPSLRTAFRHLPRRYLHFSISPPLFFRLPVPPPPLTLLLSPRAPHELELLRGTRAGPIPRLPFPYPPPSPSPAVSSPIQIRPFPSPTLLQIFPSFNLKYSTRTFPRARPQDLEPLQPPPILFLRPCLPPCAPTGAGAAADDARRGVGFPLSFPPLLPFSSPARVSPHARPQELELLQMMRGAKRAMVKVVTVGGGGGSGGGMEMGEAEVSGEEGDVADGGRLAGEEEGDDGGGEAASLGYMADHPDLLQALLDTQEEQEERGEEDPEGLWGPVQQEEWRQCDAPSRKYRDAPLPESSGYLQVFLDGGLNQQRISVCNAVAVARLLNATLLVPEFATNIFWQDSRWAAHRAAGG
ncbi:unnamed protein product [Closterium sp. NIES-54]